MKLTLIIACAVALALAGSVVYGTTGSSSVDTVSNRIQLPASTSEDLPAASAERIEITGTNHKYVVAEFSGTSDECISWHIQALDDTATLYVNYYTRSTDTAQTLWFTKIGCVPGNTGVNWDTLNLVSGVANGWTHSPSGVTDVINQSGPHSGTALPMTACTSLANNDTYMIFQLCRQGSTDSSSIPLAVESVTIVN